MGRAIDLRIIDVQANGYTTAGHGVAQTIQRGIESLAGIKLRMRDEAAGVIERGVEENLHASAIGAPNPGAEQHIGLPDQVAELGFKLLVGLGRQQLPFREAALFEEAVQSRGGYRRFVFTGRQSHFAQQRGAGAMRILALEAFDQIGELRRDGARLSPILPGLRRQGFEAAVLRGAEQSLARCAGVQLEMSIAPLYQGELLLPELIGEMAKQGFALMDLKPGFFDPRTGELLQLDGLFFRRPVKS